MAKKSIILLIFIIIWMGVIFYMSNMDGDTSGKESSDIVTFIIDKYDKLTHATNETINYHKSEEFMNKANFIFRKICHFSEYLILSVLVCLFVILIDKWNTLLCCTYSLLFSSFYAIIDEYHQTFINGRSGQVVDVLIDSLGVIVGCIITLLVINIRKKKNVLN